jgi:hypothetical protein
MEEQPCWRNQYQADGAGLWGCPQRQGCTTQQAPEEAVLTERIRAVFEPSGRTYGSPRSYAALTGQGGRWSRRRVARLMRQARLAATPPRRLPRRLMGRSTPGLTCWGAT